MSVDYSRSSQSLFGNLESVNLYFRILNLPHPVTLNLPLSGTQPSNTKYKEAKIQKLKNFKNTNMHLNIESLPPFLAQKNTKQARKIQATLEGRHPKL